MSDMKMQAAVEMSVEQPVKALDQIGVAAEKMAGKVSAAAGKAGGSVDEIGNGAQGSADQMTRAEGRMVASIKKIQTQMDLAGKSSSQKFEFNIAAKGLDASKFEPMLAKMRETEIAQARLAAGSSDLSTRLSAMAVGAFAIAASFKGVATAMVEAQQGAQKLRNSLEYAAGGAAGATQEIQYLRDVTNKLGLDFGTSSQAYAKFAAATKDSGVSLSQTKVVFEGIAAASAKLGLSADETQGALLALSQMASKGTVSAEELRGQLGERLPGAFNIAAKSMGVTTAELGKLLETGQLMASDFLPKFGQALKDNFQAPLTSLTQELNRFSSAWTLWKQEMSEGANGSGFKWMTNGLNESTAAMRSLGTEAGIVHRLLVAIGGFQAGALGANKFDTAKLQEQAMKSLPEVRGKREELESKSYLNQFEKQTLADLKRQEAAIRQSINDLAIQRGKETGINLPDLAGDYAAAQKKQNDKLGAYLGDLANAPKAAKVAAEVEKENAAFGLAVSGLSETDSRYIAALKQHNDRVAEITKKPASAAGATKNDASQQYAASLAAEKDFATAQVKLIKARVAEGVESEEAGIKEVLAAQINGYAKEREILTAQLGATKDTGDKAKLGQQIAAIGTGMQVAAAEYVSALAKIEQADAKYKLSQVDKANDSTRKIDDENEKLREQIDILGLTDIQLGEYEAAKVRAAAASEYLAASTLREVAATMEAAGSTNSAIPYYRQLAEAREAAGKALDKQGLLESEKGIKKAAVDAEKEWKKTADKIGDNITDALMRGFESGKSFAQTMRDTIVNMFKTMVLKPVIQATVMGGMSAMGMGSATAADGGASLGGLANLASTGNSLFNIGSTIANGAGALPMTTTIAEGVGALGGDSIGTLLSLNPQFGLSTGAAIGEAAGVAAAASYTAAAGTVGATASMASAYSVGAGAASAAPLAAVPVVGWIALAALAAYSIFSKDGGGPQPSGDYFGKVNANGGINQQATSTIAGDSTDNWYTGTESNGTMAVMGVALGRTVANTLKSLGGSAAGVGLNFGMSTDPQGTSDDTVKASVTNAAGQYIYTNNHSVDKGKGGEALLLEFQRMDIAAIKAADDIKPVFKEVVSGINLMTATSETLNQALADVQAVVGLRDAFKNLNLDADSLSMSIINMSGGISNLSTELGNYYTTYFSEAERNAKTADALVKSFKDIGAAVPANKEAFRAVIEGLDLTTASGASTFAAMMALAPAFASVADAAAAALSKLSETRASLTSSFGGKVTPEQATASIKSSGLIDIKGMDAAAIQSAMRIVISTATQTSLDTIKGLLPAFDLVIQGLIDSASNILSERTGLQDQLDGLTMTSAQLLNKQRDALDESNRGLFDQINAINTANTALASFATQIESIGATRANVGTASQGVKMQMAGFNAPSYWSAQQAILKAQFSSATTTASKMDIAGKWQAAIASGMDAQIAALGVTRDARISALQDEATAINNNASASRQAAQNMASALSNIADYAQGMKASSLSTLPPEAKLQAAGAEYSRLLAAAPTNADAAGKLTSASDAYLGLAKDYYASSGQYASIFTSVESQLSALGATKSVYQSIADSSAGTYSVTAAVAEVDSKYQSAVLDYQKSAVANYSVLEIALGDYQKTVEIKADETIISMNSLGVKNDTIATRITESQTAVTASIARVEAAQEKAAALLAQVAALLAQANWLAAQIASATTATASTSVLAESKP